MWEKTCQNHIEPKQSNHQAKLMTRRCFMLLADRALGVVGDRQLGVQGGDLAALAAHRIPKPRTIRSASVLDDEVQIQYLVVFKAV